jgi:alpha-galactosidase
VNLKIIQTKFRLDSTIVSLSGIQPLINGVPVAGAPVISSDDQIYFPLPNGQATMHLEVVDAGERRCWVRYWLEGLSTDFRLQSFGLRFDVVENLRVFLRNGYFSWDGSFYVQAEEVAVGHRTQGYAVTQLLPLFGTGSLIIGFERHDRYQQVFTFTREESSFSLQIETLWDEKAHQGNVESERLVIFEHDAVENALREWAQVVAAVMKPRLTTPRITGWCSWYHLYASISDEIIMEHLHGVQQTVKREALPMWVFQIDDGFTPEMGDWLDLKPQFPRGMKPLLDDIRAAGFTPGLWIAPFMVGNRSRLYREHPDWVVKERETGKPLAHMRLYGEFRWHKRSEEYYILDTTHPDAFAYLRQVFHIWRHEWGCEYFKTDFMQFGSEYGPDRALWHQSGMSRIEIWRRTAEMIRDVIGDAVWLGCGCPLWASVGLVDAVRIGRDVGVEWRGDNLSAQSLLRDQATRNFANHLLWQADPDCILLRERFHHLTETEVKALAIYAGMSGGLIVTSDDLSELSAERLRLWKLLLSPEKVMCHFPLLGQSPLVLQDERTSNAAMRSLDPVLVQLRQPRTGVFPATVALLNTGETTVQRSYPLSALGLPNSLYVANWNTGENSETPASTLNLTIEAHDAVLLFLSDTPFTAIPHMLP